MSLREKEKIQSMKSPGMKSQSQPPGVVGDHIILKKTRMIQGLSRREAGLILSSSRATIQRIESGKHHIPHEKKRHYVESYGFTMNEFMKMKMGQNVGSGKSRSVQKLKVIEHKHLRRSYQKKITREVLAISRLRKRRRVSQYKASELCGWHRTAVGHIENGRIELTPKKLDTLLSALGYTKKQFNEQFCSEIDRDSIEQQCFRLIEKMEDSKLVSVHSILQSFVS